MRNCPQNNFSSRNIPFQLIYRNRLAERRMELRMPLQQYEEIYIPQRIERENSQRMLSWLIPTYRWLKMPSEDTVRG